MGPMIRAASLRGFVPLVEELGGDVDGLLEPFGLSRRLVAADDALVSITTHDRMLDAAADALSCPDLGLRLAERQDVGILGPLAVAIESSSNATSALACASRFMFVHSPALHIGLEPDPCDVRGVVAVTYRKDLRESPYSAQGMELGLGVLYLVSAMLTGGTIRPRSVEIPHPPMSPVERYTKFFGTDVRFGRSTGALRIEQHRLKADFATANEEIRRVALDHLVEAYADPGQETSTHVRRALAGSLATTSPALSHVARLLMVHPRTLQRRLAAEGTSFERVLEEVRREATHRYLTTSDLPLAQVARLVGFTEQSTLTHAVRRWYATTPRQLRRTGASPH